MGQFWHSSHFTFYKTFLQFSKFVMCTVIQVILFPGVLFKISSCTTLNSYNHVFGKIGIFAKKNQSKIFFILFFFHTPWQYFAWISCALLLALIWLFPLVLKSYKNVFGRLKYTNIFKSILYHCFYSWLTDLPQSVEWGDFSMNGRILKVSFDWLT